MPTVQPGDRVTLKSGRSPLANQIPEWKDDRAFKPFDDDQQFEVLAVDGSKVELQAVDHFEARPFTWFKNAIAKVRSANTSEPVNTTSSEPAKPSVDDDWDAPDPAFAPIKTREVNRIHVSHNGVAIEFEERREPPKEQEQSTAKTLEFPSTQAKFATAISPYKDCQYWVEGSHAKGKAPAQYYYCIQRNGSVTKSDVPYDSVYYAGRWAREAIDKLATIVEV